MAAVGKKPMRIAERANSATYICTELPRLLAFENPFHMPHATQTPPRKDLKQFAAIEVGALKAARAEEMDLYMLAEDGESLPPGGGRLL